MMRPYYSFLRIGLQQIPIAPTLRRYMLHILNSEEESCLKEKENHTLTDEKRHKIKKFANYQNKIVGNSLAFYRHDLFLLKTVDSWFLT